MPAHLFFEWQEYAAIRPFGDRRADYRAAQIVAALYNINRDPKKKPDPWPIEQFLLQFSDMDLPPSSRRKQTWQEQKAIAYAIVAAYSQPSKKKKPTPPK